MVKCEKCGADIPDGAAFCPGCGAPRPVQLQAPPAPQPTYQPKPVKQSSGAGMKGFADTIFSRMMIMLGVSIALLLAWIGKILTIFTSGTVYQVGNILTFTGLTGIGFILFGGAFLNTKLNNYIRLGMIVAAGILITFALAMSFSFSMPGFNF